MNVWMWKGAAHQGNGDRIFGLNASEMYKPAEQPLRKEIRKGNNTMEQVPLKTRLQVEGVCKSLDHQGSALVEKCLNAVQAGDISGFTKKHFESALGALALAHGAENDLSYHKAYVAILQTPVGAELYDGYGSAPTN